MLLPLLYCDTDSTKSACKLLQLLYPLLYCDTDSTTSACKLLQLLLLHLSWLYCLTDSTTFIQSARRCRMGKSWRVLVIYTSWVTLSKKIQLPCSYKFLKLKLSFILSQLWCVFYHGHHDFLLANFCILNVGSPKVWLTLRAQPTWRSHFWTSFNSYSG